MVLRWTASAAALALGMVAVPLGAQNAAAPATPAASSSAKPGIPPQITAFVAGLHKQTGDVAVPDAHATLHLGDHYYFIGADETKKVLTDIWGNPPDAVSHVLGMVLPADKTVIDNVWGAVVTYEDTGYVADKDADAQDYNKVLDDLREGEDDNNAERKKQGYPTSHVVGWAQPPAYDKAAHSLIWARDINYEGGKVDTLNYDVRLLGRKGVLSLNMVSDMAHLAEVRDAAKTFGAAASFDKGLTYADYDSKVDKTAEYGLAGLVAAGIGAVAVKKLGLLAIVLGFGKKIAVVVAVGAAAAWRKIKGLFGRGEDAAEG